MSIFRLIILAIPAMDLAWWYWGDRRLRGLRYAWKWRIGLGAFVGLNLAVYAGLIASRLNDSPERIPTLLLSLCYIWHLLVLPVTISILTGTTLLRAIRAAVAWSWRLFAGSLGTRSAAPDDASSDPPGQAGPSDVSEPGPHALPTRRQVLAAGLVAVPPVLTGLGQARAMTQIRSFRIRRLDLEIAALPPALDGMTIAHVSDLHVGRFTNGGVLEEVVARTNALGADLIAFTGDLIDHALEDLPAGIDVLQRLEPRGRLFVIEGNHDLFEGRAAFESRVRDAGLPLLLNEAASFELRGQRVQVLGLQWGQPGAGRGSRIETQLDRVLPQREDGAFPILLAHHPHAFDRAADAGIPLTLAGHTHGGQFMLNEALGAGPAMFRYWSGAYRRGDAALAVSNGVGNWFPLRINAPAEILHLRLRRG